METKTFYPKYKVIYAFMIVILVGLLYETLAIKSDILIRIIFSLGWILSIIYMLLAVTYKVIFKKYEIQEYYFFKFRRSIKIDDIISIKKFHNTNRTLESGGYEIRGNFKPGFRFPLFKLQDIFLNDLLKLKPTININSDN